MADSLWGSVRENVGLRFEEIKLLFFAGSSVLVGFIVFGILKIPYHYMAIYFLLFALFLIWRGEVVWAEKERKTSAFVQVMGSFLFAAMMIGFEIIFMLMTIVLFWVQNNFNSMAGSIFTFNIFWLMSLFFVLVAFLFVAILLYFVYRFNANNAFYLILLLIIVYFAADLILSSTNVLSVSIWLFLVGYMEQMPGFVLLVSFVMVLIITLFSIDASYKAVSNKMDAEDAKDVSDDGLIEMEEMSENSLD